MVAIYLLQIYLISFDYLLNFPKLKFKFGIQLIYFFLLLKQFTFYIFCMKRKYNFSSWSYTLTVFQ